MHNVFQQFLKKGNKDNRAVNNTGEKGANIAIDKDTEHSNNFAKQGVKRHRFHIHELVKKAVQFNIYSELEGRSYKQFCDFQRDRLENISASDLYQFEAAFDALANNHVQKANKAFKEVMDLVQHCSKPLRIVDNSEFGRETVNQ